MMSPSDTATSTTTTSHDHDHPLPPPDQQTTCTTTRDQEEQEQLIIKPVEYLDSFPVGYRFMPTDREVLHYLTLRYQKKTLPPNRINEVNLYDHHPEYLTSPGRFMAYENKEWYFFTPRDRKYPNGNRPSRSAGDGDDKGYWKATGADKKILGPQAHKLQADRKVLGSKKTLVFYKGKAPKGTKTCWVMHEFKLDETSIQRNSRPDMLLDDSVLCRIHIKEKKKSTDTTTTSSGSRKKKSVVSFAEEDDDNDHLQEEEAEEEDHLQEDEDGDDEDGDEEEEANISARGETEAIANISARGETETEADISIRGETVTDIYNDMEVDSIMQQYYPTDHDHTLNNILNNISSCSTSIMGAVSSSSTTASTRGNGATNILPLQTCPPTTWVNNAPVLNEDYMYTSGTAAPDMVSISVTHNNHNIRQDVDQIQQWGTTYSGMLTSSSSIPDGHRPLLADQQWVIPGYDGHPLLLADQQWVIPDGHPPLPNQQWGNSSLLPAGHPPLPKVLQVPQCYSIPPLQMQEMPPQMPPQMQQQQQQQQGYYQQCSSCSWTDSNNNIDGSSSAINKLHDHAIRRERHMASFKENDNNSTVHPEYFIAGGNPASFDQTSFSNKTFINGTSTLPDFGRSRR